MPRNRIQAAIGRVSITAIARSESSGYSSRRSGSPMSAGMTAKPNTARMVPPRHIAMHISRKCRAKFQPCLPRLGRAATVVSISRLLKRRFETRDTERGYSGGMRACADSHPCHMTPVIWARWHLLLCVVSACGAMAGATQAAPTRPPPSTRGPASCGQRVRADRGKLATLSGPTGARWQHFWQHTRACAGVGTGRTDGRFVHGPGHRRTSADCWRLTWSRERGALRRRDPMARVGRTAGRARNQGFHQRSVSRRGPEPRR